MQRLMCRVPVSQRERQRPAVSVQSAESHGLRELEQIKSHPASLTVTSWGRHSQPLNASFHLTGFKPQSTRPIGR